MNKKSMLLAFGSSMFFSATAFGTPVVSDVVMSQDLSSRRVTINYKLTGESGIVTVDIQTNNGANAFVSIGAKNVQALVGDVNCVVSPDAANLKTITWRPDKSWPGNKIDLIQGISGVRAELKAWALNAPPDYMVISLEDGNVRYFPSEESLPYGGVSNNLYKTSLMAFRRIHAANVQWRMGAGTKEYGAADNEVAHEVVLTHDYYMGVYEVTQQQCLNIMDQAYTNGYFRFGTLANYATRPAENVVSWDKIRGTKKGKGWPNSDLDVAHQVDDDSILGKLRAKTNLRLDLPTEAQWEYACRGGTTSAIYTGTEIAESLTVCPEIDPLARYKYNGGYIGGTTVPPNTCGPSNATACVGTYLKNPWGLYDMYGNVREWCLDYYVKDLGSSSVTYDPVGGTSGNRVVRGTAWTDAGRFCRSAYRLNYVSTTAAYNQGFRLCLTLY